MDRDESPELIKEQMTQTTRSLTDKVAALETSVVGTLTDANATVQQTVQSVQDSVQSVKDVVEETVSSVKDTVQGSVESVSSGIKSAFDVSSHVQGNPWAMVAGAATVGFVTGLVVFKSRAEPPFDRLADASPEPMSSRTFSAVTAAPDARPVEPRKPGMFDELFEMARKEIGQLGRQALSQLVASAKQALDQKVPEMVNTFADRIPSQFGGGKEPAPVATERPKAGGGFQHYT